MTSTSISRPKGDPLLRLACSAASRHAQLDLSISLLLSNDLNEAARSQDQDVVESLRSNRSARCCLPSESPQGTKRRRTRSDWDNVGEEQGAISSRLILGVAQKVDTASRISHCLSNLKEDAPVLLQASLSSVRRFKGHFDRFLSRAFDLRVTFGQERASARATFGWRGARSSNRRSARSSTGPIASLEGDQLDSQSTYKKSTGDSALKEMRPLALEPFRLAVPA
jgi:hypothetical protein